MTARQLLTAALAVAMVLLGTPVRAHDGHHSPVPWQACEDKQLDEPCEYRNTAGDLYRGSCREMQQQLLCVRNQPIVKGSAAAGQLAPERTEELKKFGTLPGDTQYKL
jgi:hypothetical protein